MLDDGGSMCRYRCKKMKTEGETELEEEKRREKVGGRPPDWRRWLQTLTRWSHHRCRCRQTIAQIRSNYRQRNHCLRDSDSC